MTGLDLSQILAAIRETGFAPWVSKPDNEPGLFKLGVKACLASGIPVILYLHGEGVEYHAVTLVGYRESSATDFSPDIVVASSQGPQLVSGGIEKVYAHDDRLGPYARFLWKDPTAETNDLPSLTFDPQEPGFKEFETAMGISRAVVPLYPKLRLAPFDLVELGSQHLPFVRHLAGNPEYKDIRVDFRFMHSGTYLRGLLESDLDSNRAAKLAMAAALPRYVAVVRYQLSGEMILELVGDTTDIKRDAPGPWLLVVVGAPKHVSTVEQYGRFSPAAVR